MDLNLAEAMKNIVAKGIQTDINPSFSSSNYITEKLYMLLQLYLKNKGWNPSIELLQCFTELQESSMLPSASYLQMLASRVTLDTQGRLILRENGKIILPFEHFGNAVMLKHMNGPHGLHLGLEATTRAVVESYTIGRENFGMEKEFIVEMVQSCRSPACRFYKAQLDLSHSHNNKPTYIPEVQPPVLNSSVAPPSSSTATITPSMPPSDIMVSSMAPPLQLPPPISTPTRSPSRPPSVDIAPPSDSSSTPTNNNKLMHSTSESPTPSTPLPPPSPKPPPKPLTPRQQQQNKLADFLKANLENFDNIANVKELNGDGCWPDDGKRQDAGQEKIIRAFSEIMKNMNRMKSCVRPAMCKPYGKQSEALQKTVIDTIQLVQSLRSFLPPPHIAVSSWKNEDKQHNRIERKSTMSCGANAMLNTSSVSNANNVNNNNNVAGSTSVSVSIEEANGNPSQ